MTSLPVQPPIDQERRDMNAFASALAAAAQERSPALFDMLLSTPWASLAQVEDFHPTILACIKEDNVEFLQKVLSLLPEGSAGNAIDACRALLYCARHGSLGCLETLARSGAYLGYRDRQGHTMLASSIEHSDEAFFDKLLEIGADPNDYVVDPRAPMPRSLSLAVFKYRFEQAKRLLDAGADPNVINENGCTLLGKLATLRLGEFNLGFLGAALDMAHALLDAGADIDIRDAEGLSPLHIACDRGSIPFAKFLLERGADHRLPHSVIENSLLPLEFCISHNKIEMALLLTEYDQDMTAETWERLMLQARSSSNPEHASMARARHESWLLATISSPAASNFSQRATL